MFLRSSTSLEKLAKRTSIDAAIRDLSANPAV
jgi:hypothetical protein